MPIHVSLVTTLLSITTLAPSLILLRIRISVCELLTRTASGTVAPASPTPELLSLPPGPELNRDSLLDENEQNKRIVYKRFRTSFKGPSFPAPYERARAVTETED
eukprot:1417504-Rhodomonas_salina.2